MGGHEEENIVICGGGIIGASIAYHLSLRGVKAAVYEQEHLGAAASGKAAGFMAGSWGDGGVTEQLHRVSFKMHEALASELGIQSYRKIPTLSVAGGARSSGTKPPAQMWGWLDGEVSKAALMDRWTAQVTPKEVTDKLMERAVANGAVLKIGKVEGVELEELVEGVDRKVKCVIVDGKQVPCTKVVIAMGPWSCMAEEWFDNPIPMEGVKSTSVIFKSGGSALLEKAPAALFCSEDEHGCHLEVYPRPDGDIYVCGLGGSDYLDNDRIKKTAPKDVDPNMERVKAAQSSFSALSSLGQGHEVHAQACMRPCAPDALPILGQIDKCSNAYIAAGHNCWGILWAPVTGLAMTELMLDGEAQCVCLKAFSPSRFKKETRKRRERGRHNTSNPVGEQW
mmetsp:Transcript_36646/g.90167  ORF Transcript_36646/g.90167 Transcript_36646/m.90167 type:complete len:395 (+) Transcript_36646:78-1262(+)